MPKFARHILCLLAAFLAWAVVHGHAIAGEKPKQGAHVDADNLPLPAGAIARLGTTRLSQFDSVVETLCFTPDDKYVISAGEGPIRVWDVKSGKQVRTIGTGRTAALSQDGKLLAVSGYGEDAPARLSNSRAVTCSADSAAKMSGFNARSPQMARCWQQVAVELLLS
jgi:hypothetical protein